MFVRNILIKHLIHFACHSINENMSIEYFITPSIKSITILKGEVLELSVEIIF